MFKKEKIKRRNKKELLEILVLQSKRIDELEKELEETKELLDSKLILINESGSIAEAALKLNEVFEKAEEAANQYLENVKRKKNKNNLKK